MQFWSPFKRRSMGRKQAVSCMIRTIDDYFWNGSGGGIMRTKITLACTECKQRNYNTTKEKKTHPDRMEIKKYCRFCKTHTLHKETK